MPRNTKYIAEQKLNEAIKNFERSKKATTRAQDYLYAAMVKAVESGLTRGEVGKMVGVTGARVGQIPGMPPGANTHKEADL